MLIEHLKTRHYYNDESVFCYSYENYFDLLTHSLSLNSYQFSEIQPQNLKLTFGVRYAKKFTLIRFPEYRKIELKPQSKKSAEVVGKRHILITLLVATKVTLIDQ